MSCVHSAHTPSNDQAHMYICPQIFCIEESTTSTARNHLHYSTTRHSIQRGSLVIITFNERINILCKPRPHIAIYACCTPCNLRPSSESTWVVYIACEFYYYYYYSKWFYINENIYFMRAARRTTHGRRRSVAETIWYVQSAHSSNIFIFLELIV